MKVEVAYARPEIQVLVSVEVDGTTTVHDAIDRSGLLRRFPEIDLSRNKVGIFGKPCDLGRRLAPGDRVEIYRPLCADPQDLRRSRAARREVR